MLCYPSNEFGNQEIAPAEIAPLVASYGLPTEGGGGTVMAMAELNGPSADPVWRLATRHFPGGVHWNFAGTFLFDQQGQPVGRFRMPSELDRLSERLATLLQMSEA